MSGYEFNHCFKSGLYLIYVQFEQNHLPLGLLLKEIFLDMVSAGWVIYLFTPEKVR